MQQLLIESAIEERATEFAGKFYSRDLAEREKAGTELCWLPERDIDLLLEILRIENKKKVRRFWTGFALGVAILLAVNVVLGIFTHVGGALAGAFSTVPMGIAVAYAPSKLQKRAAAALAECNDVRAVGPLTDALEKQDKATIGYATAALTRLLPKLKESDFGLIDEEQRKVLHKFVLSGSGDFSHAILQGLTSIGDSRAIPSLEKLASGKGPARKRPELKREARQVIEAIQARIPAEKLRETLLRAANAPEDPPSVLLRPAGAASESDTATLLRPSQSET